MTVSTHNDSVVSCVKLDPNAVIPRQQHADDAGFDLVSIERHVLAPGERASVGTGLALALKPGTVGMICPRSGTAARHGIALVNAPGIIDAGYRGEVRILLINTDQTASFTVEPGDRIGQMVIIPFLSPVFVEVAALESSERGAGGFGSTGRR